MSEFAFSFFQHYTNKLNMSEITRYFEFSFMIAEGLLCGTRGDEELLFAFAVLMLMLMTPKTSGSNMSPSAAAPSAVDAPLLHSA